MSLLNLYLFSKIAAIIKNYLHKQKYQIKTTKQLTD